MRNNIIILVLLLAVFTANGQTSLNLDQCKEHALKYNPTLKQNLKQVEAAEENIDAAQKDFYPTVDIGGDANYWQNPLTITSGRVTNEANQSSYSLSAPIIQNVYSGGNVRKNKELAEQQLNISVNYKESYEDFLMVQTEIAFWKGIYNAGLNDLSQAYSDAIDGLVSVVRDKVEAEVISRNDLLLLEVRQNEASLFEMITHNDYELAIMDLNRLIGFPMDSLVTLTGDLTNTQTQVKYISASQAVVNRPEYKAQEFAVDAQLTKAGLTKAAYMPNLYVGVNPIWGAPNTNFGSSSPNYNTAFFAGVNIPIVRWGKKSDEVKREKLKAEASRFELQELSDQLSLELNTSDYQLQQAAERVDLTANSLTKAEENLSIMTDRYLEGLTSILEVLDAQLYWQRSYKDLLDAQLYYKNALVVYKRASGQL